MLITICAPPQQASTHLQAVETAAIVDLKESEGPASCLAPSLDPTPNAQGCADLCDGMI